MRTYLAALLALTLAVERMWAELLLHRGEGVELARGLV